MSRRRATIVASIYAGYVLIATLYPFEWSPDFERSLNRFLAGFVDLIGGIARGLSRRDFVLNIFFFAPFGVLLYCFIASPKRSKTLSVLFAILCAGSISFVIELCQVFFSRRPTAFDVLANTLGAGLGASVAALVPGFVADLVSRLCTSRVTLAAMACVGLLFGAFPFFSSVVQLVEPFRIWNSRFTFQIGNEATLDRPWLGKLYFVALYSRALSPDEVVKNFSEGFASGASKNRLPEGVISLYTFSEGKGNVVHDLSGSEAPLDLIISPKGHVRWLDSRGIEIVRPAIARSRGAASKIFEGANATQELTLEVWMTPDNTVQGGPARVVSFSRNNAERNFTLGQEGSDVHFRLRTPVAGKNGSPLALKTTSGFLTSQAFHLVATYKGGFQRLYVNGVEQPEKLDLITDGIIAFGTRKTAAAQLAYSFFYFFPASFFIAALLATRSKSFLVTLLLPCIVSAALLLSAEIPQGLASGEGVDIPLLGYGLIIAAIGALNGRAFVTESYFPVKEFLNHG